MGRKKPNYGCQSLEKPKQGEDQQRLYTAALIHRRSHRFRIQRKRQRKRELLFLLRTPEIPTPSISVVDVLTLPGDLVGVATGYYRFTVVSKPVPSSTATTRDYHAAAVAFEHMRPADPLPSLPHTRIER
jgi:hypothetical protein